MKILGKIPGVTGIYKLVDTSTLTNAGEEINYLPDEAKLP
jgi:hypothetical protein